MLEAEKIRSVVEGLLFAADAPLSAEKIRDIVGEENADIEAVRSALVAIEAACRAPERGVRIEEAAGGYQFRTKLENAFWIQRMYGARSGRLSQAALEVLAIIAYRQPVTRPEIEDVRGVDSGGVLRALLDKGLIRIAGKKDEPGRPILYGTSREFLAHFGINSLADLPSLKEFQDLGEQRPTEAPASGAPATMAE